MAENPVAKAIAESDAAIHQARLDTRHRRRWGYLQTDSEAEAIKTFQRPEGTPVRLGYSSSGERVMAVWLGPGTPTADDEPHFTYDVWPPPPAPLRRRHKVAALVGAVVFLAAVVAVILFTRR